MWIRAVVFVALTALSAAPPEPRPIVLSFQHGADAYSGTIDTELWALAPTTILERNPNATSDADNDGGES